MQKRHKKRRIPQLKYTDNRGIGWHVSYRDASGVPRRHRFEVTTHDDALDAYHKWLSAHVAGDTPSSGKSRQVAGKLAVVSKPKPKAVKADIVSGSLLHIASGFLSFEQSRVRAEEGPRVKGTIKKQQYDSKKLMVQEFLKFLNDRYGQGAVSRLKLADLTMHDVEGYNQLLVTTGFSDSQIRKRLQVVEQVINRAGRPEHGGQLLTWNWNSRDILHGRPDNPIAIPTLRQLKLILQKCDVRRTAMVWLAIGCGFGPRDLAKVRVGDIDKIGYDLRRPKTGIDRYGSTPKLVWNCVEKYLEKFPRGKGELLFVTRLGRPLVHHNTNSITEWWSDLRSELGEDGKGLNGFYSLRHLGATEFGSRAGCSIGEVRRWLGHSASSAVADRYMKPVSPQSRLIVEYVRKALSTGKVSLKI
jgi:integrase